MKIIHFIYIRSSIFLTVLSLWAGYWLSDHLGNTPSFPGFLDLIFDYILNFRTPIPYFLFVLGVEVWGYVSERSTTAELSDLRSSVSKVPTLEASIRIEKQEHAESKSSYSDTLKAALRLMLCASITGFDYRCRVTIYRRQAETDNELRQIFRHSENRSFKVGGRYKIPLDEGVVGAAWNNHGTKHVSVEPDFGSAEFYQEMQDLIETEGCQLPSCDLSMPSTEFYAKALDDHESGHRVGIVVYECVEQNVINVDEIDKILTEQSLELARFVKHLGRLDLEFAPTVREE